MTSRSVLILTTDLLLVFAVSCEILRQDPALISVDQTVDQPEVAVVDRPEVISRWRRSVGGRPSMSSGYIVTGDTVTKPPLSYQDIYVIRERTRQRRIFLLQQQIFSMFRFNNRPNMTSLPQGTRQVLPGGVDVEKLDRFMGLFNNESGNSKIYVLGPSCPARNLTTDTGSGNSMRLVFNTEALRTRRRPVQVTYAGLRLHWNGHIPPLSTAPAAVAVHRRRRITTPQPSSRRRTSKVISRRRHPVDDSSSNDTGLLVTVYQLTKPHAVDNSRNDGKKQIEQVAIHRHPADNWVKIDVKSAVEDWIKKPNKNHGLEVIVTDKRGHKKQREIDAEQVLDGNNCTVIQQDGDTDSSGASSYLVSVQPGLEVIVQEPARAARRTADGRHRHRKQKQDNVITARPPAAAARRTARPHRQPRHVEPPSKRNLSNQSTCMMDRFHVSMEELGVNAWVVEPKSIVTGFCYGSCSSSEPVQQQTAAAASDSQSDRLIIPSVPEHCSCCPTKFQRQRMLYVEDSGSIVYRSLYVVTECGCRPS